MPEILLNSIHALNRYHASTTHRYNVLFLASAYPTDPCCSSWPRVGYPLRGGPTPTINDDKMKIRPSGTRGINQVDDF